MSHYTNGRAFEYRTIKALQDAGYETIRAAQSKGVADIWAARKGSPLLLVQCKKGKSAVSKEEWDKLYETADKIGAVAVLVQGTGKNNKPPNWWRLTGKKIVRRQMKYQLCQEWKP